MLAWWRTAAQRNASMNYFPGTAISAWVAAQNPVQTVADQLGTLLPRICIGRSEKMRTTIALAVTIAAIAACGLQVSAQSQSFEEYFEERLRNAFENSSRDDEEYLRFEWEGYDGWYNNPAHPDWGGAGKTIITCALH